MHTAPTRPSASAPASMMSSMVDRIDPIKLILVGFLAVLALIVWSAGRNQIVRPLDNLLTERACLDYADVIGRAATGYERSNRFGLVNRSEGYCSYGQGPNGEAPITLTIAETDPSPLYRGAKWFGIITQLGIVSIFLRLTVDPVLDSYRFVKDKLS